MVTTHIIQRGSGIMCPMCSNEVSTVGMTCSVECYNYMAEVAGQPTMEEQEWFEWMVRYYRGL